MEVTIKGEPKEIAALVLAVQERQEKLLQKISDFESWKDALEERFGENLMIMDACQIDNIVNVISKRLQIKKDFSENGTRSPEPLI